jgi:hypothetical protein
MKTKRSTNSSLVSTLEYETYSNAKISKDISIFENWAKAVRKRASDYLSKKKKLYLSKNKKLKGDAGNDCTYLLKEEAKIKGCDKITNGWHNYYKMSNNPEVLIIGQNPYRMALTIKNKDKACLTRSDYKFLAIANYNGILHSKSQIINFHSMRYYYYNIEGRKLLLVKNHISSCDDNKYKLNEHSSKILDYYLNIRTIKCIAVLTAKNKFRKLLKQKLEDKQKGKGRKRKILVIFSHHPSSSKFTWETC